MLAVTYAGRLSVAGDVVEIVRDADLSSETVSARLPALVSVYWHWTGEARDPLFKGIMAAKKKPVMMWSLADLGVDAGLVGLGGARSAVLSAVRRPRTAGQMVKDDGDGGSALADFLVAQRFI